VIEIQTAGASMSEEALIGEWGELSGAAVFIHLAWTWAFICM
jgi:hypothetical protein